jgi:hypothetical protein
MPRCLRPKTRSRETHLIGEHRYDYLKKEMSVGGLELASRNLSDAPGFLNNDVTDCQVPGAHGSCQSSHLSVRLTITWPWRFRWAVCFSEIVLKAYQYHVLALIGRTKQKGSEAFRNAEH